MTVLPSDFFFLYLPGALVTAFVGVGFLVSSKPRLRGLGALLFAGGIGGILSTMTGITGVIAHILGVS
jgi:hypothetical protein